MDTRETSQQEELDQIKSTVKGLSEDQSILQINSLKLNNQFKNAMIFNLITKMDTKAVMEKVYLNELENIESFPKEMKYHIHFPYLLHGSLILMFYLRYKRQLNSATAIGILCAGSLLNEFGRYKRVQACNKQNWVKYNESSQNYDYLMKSQLNSGGIHMRDIMKYFFKIDIDNSYARIKHIFFDDLLNDDVITTQFF